MTPNPLPSLHKLLTAYESGQSVRLNAQEVAELSEHVIAARMTQLAIWNEHQALAAELQRKHATVH